MREGEEGEEGGRERERERGKRVREGEGGREGWSVWVKVCVSVCMHIPLQIRAKASSTSHL